MKFSVLVYWGDQERTFEVEGGNWFEAAAAADALIDAELGCGTLHRYGRKYCVKTVDEGTEEEYLNAIAEQMGRGMASTLDKVIGEGCGQCPST